MLALIGLDYRLNCYLLAGDYVYLGTASGKLLLYKVTNRLAGSGRTEYSATKERAVDVGSSRSAVTQIEAIPDLQVLVALCDGAVSLHRISNLDRVPSMLDSKHAVQFAVNAKARRLCIVSSKRRLKLFEWVDGKFTPVRGHPELDVPDVPRALVYYGPRICLGYSREYNILYEDTGEVHDIPGGIGRDTRPLIKHLPGDNLMIVCTDDVGVVLNASGEPAMGATVLQFGHHPLAIGYCYPYILSIGEGNTKVEVHASRGAKDEVVQALTIPSGVVALSDGRVGTTSKLDIDSMDTAKGRNPLYLAFSNPGKVVRLQPVPVDRQVEDMLRQYQVAAACELIVNTCTEPTMLSAKVSRLNIDAGRVFFLGLHFEQAFAFLTASPIDPREILQMFPDLLPGSTNMFLSASLVAPGSHGARIAAAASSSSSSHSLETPSYNPYPSRYFSVSLTQAIASGLKQPGEAASEAADARGSEAMVSTMSYAGVGGRLDSFADGAGGFGGSSSTTSAGMVQTGVADIVSLVKSQFSSYVKRNNKDSDDFGKGDLGVGAPSSPGTQEGRVTAAYEGMLQFLRHRRAVVMHALRRARGQASDGAGAELPPSRHQHHHHNEAQSRLPLHAVFITRERQKRFVSRGSAFSAGGYLESELLEVASIIDGAILKCFTVLKLVRHLDRHVFKPNRVDPADAAAFLRAQGRYHSLALFYAGRGMAREALAIWRDLGLGTVAERREGGSAADAMKLGSPNKGRFGSIASERDRRRLRAGTAGTTGSGAQSRRSSNASRDRSGSDASSSSGSSDGSEAEKDRHDSLSDFEDVASHPSYSGALRTAASGSAVDRALYAGGANDITPLAIALSYSDAQLSSYDGVEDTISFLRFCDDQSTVFDFAEWLLLRQPQRAIAVFTQPRRSKQIPDDSILEYLSGPRFVDMARRNPAHGVVRIFLEHLVYMRGSDEERYHTRLAREYIACVVQLRGDMPGGGSILTPSIGGSAATAAPLSPILSSAGPSAGMTISDPALAARMALAGTVSDRPSPGGEGGMLGEFRGKLMRLLQESDRYDAGALLGLVKDSTLYEERVVLHGRLKQHERALALLVNELADADKAVEYCDLHSQLNANPWAPSSSSAASVPVDQQQQMKPGEGGDPFLYLLRIYLDAHQQWIGTSGASTPAGPTGSKHSVYLGKALDLLSTHAQSMDALSAARLLPADLPLHALLAYCARVLPSSAHTAREATVVKNLYNYRYIDVHSTLVERQERCATVTRNSYCHVCDKRIGDSVFAVLPDNRPVHFHCSRDLASYSAAPSQTTSALAATAADQAASAAFRLYQLPPQFSGPIGGRGQANTTGDFDYHQDIDGHGGDHDDFELDASQYVTTGTVDPGSGKKSRATTGVAPTANSNRLRCNSNSSAGPPDRATGGDELRGGGRGTSSANSNGDRAGTGMYSTAAQRSVQLAQSSSPSLGAGANPGNPFASISSSTPAGAGMTIAKPPPAAPPPTGGSAGNPFAAASGAASSGGTSSSSNSGKPGLFRAASAKK